MKPEFALFLFDIDGTLLPPSPIHGDAFAYAFRTVYKLSLDIYNTHTTGRTDTWILIEPLRRAGLSDEDIIARLPEAYEAMITYVSQHLGDLRHEVFPGVSKVLEQLRRENQMLGLLTGNLSKIAMLKMQKAGLDQYFNFGAFGEESEVRADLVPVALSKASQLLGYPIPANQAVIIGDTLQDVEAGKAHGTLTVSVATGVYNEDELRSTGTDLVFPSFEESISAVKALLRLVHTSSIPET